MKKQKNAYTYVAPLKGIHANWMWCDFMGVCPFFFSFNRMLAATTTHLLHISYSHIVILRLADEYTLRYSTRVQAYISFRFYLFQFPNRQKEKRNERNTKKKKNKNYKLLTVLWVCGLPFLNYWIHAAITT